jgi:hypothetical protein
MKPEKINKEVESLTQVDFSDLIFPMVTVYKRPLDFPNDYIARVFEGEGPFATNIFIRRKTLGEIRNDIRAAGFNLLFKRAEDDYPTIEETWTR